MEEEEEKVGSEEKIGSEEKAESEERRSVESASECKESRVKGATARKKSIEMKLQSLGPGVVEHYFQTNCPPITDRRGYYSELVTKTEVSDEEEETLGCYKRTKLLWQVRNLRHAPILTSLEPPDKPFFLAPAERWMSFKEEKQIVDFPVDTFKPKVQMQHEALPLQIPRNVAIERLRRIYQNVGIQKYLNEMGIQLKEILPVHLLQERTPDLEKFGLFKTTNYLPLELFDNEEYDSRSPQSWLDHGLLEDIRHPIPGEAFVPLSKKTNVPLTVREPLNYLYEWVNVAVTDYDPDLNLWSVLTLDGEQRAFRLPRIYLMFKAEDPTVFGNRIKAALDLRNETENLLRYEFYLDCMIYAGSLEMADDMLERVVNLASRGKNINTDNTPYLEEVMEEVKLNHLRQVSEIQFREIALKEVHTYKFMKVPPRAVDKIPEFGFVPTGIQDYKGRREYFRWYSLYVHDEAYRAMTQIVQECENLKLMSLFTTSIGKYVTLEEFEATENHHLNNMINFLKDTWLEKIAQTIRMCLGYLGKGWFDMLERKHDIYDIAKLLRMMELIKHRMQNALRDLVLNSAEKLTTLVETPCQVCLEIEDDFEWGPDLVNSDYRPFVPAIFALIMKMDENGAFYSTDLDEFKKMLLRLYDGGITQTHFIRQVHPKILDKLKFPGDLYLSSMGLMSARIVELREKFCFGYDKSLIPLRAYAKEYDIHIDLFTMSVDDYVNQYKEDNHIASEYREEIGQQFKMKWNLEATLPPCIFIGPFYLNIDPLRTFLVNKRQEIAQKLLDQFAEKMRNHVLDVLEEYHNIVERLSDKPTSIEHIFDIRDWMETIPMTVRQQDDLTRRYMLEYEVLESFWYALNQEDFENKWEAVGWPYKIQQLIEQTNQFLLEETDKFLKIQLNDELVLMDKIEIMTVQVTQLSAQRDFAKCHDIAIDIRRMWKTMKEAQELGQLLNHRQKLFGLPVVPFENLNKLLKEFEPYKNLWLTASDWLKSHEMWLDNPLVNIDGDAIERTLMEMYKTMTKSIRVFADIPGVQKVAIDVKADMEEFKPLIPIILALRNPGMRERHWEEFLKRTNVEIPWGPTLTFQQCLDLNIIEYSEQIIDVSDGAAKEYAIEQTLDKMEAEWENNNLELTAYKKTGTFIMRVSDEIQQMLDDHMILTQQISFSPYKMAFEERIDEWEGKLKLTSQVIEEWMDVQKQWMYLEPIFTSEDIATQLPAETKKYRSMERSWRRIMRDAFECPKIIMTCPDKKLLESLKDANHLLEIVEKGLAEYLENKRMIFPRLFFLSDDELLEILSQAKNPRAVQPHLRKCFENIAMLTFEDDNKITQMFSAEEECVDLNPTLYPTKQVENWLGILEDSMRNTVRTIFGESIKAIYKNERKDWVMSWPGQVVIAGSQTFWTAEVERGIRDNKLDKFLNKVLLTNLDALRNLTKAKLTSLQRDVLSALIVIEVHARDVTIKLVDNDVMSVNDFDWISQLRYYWVDDVQLKIRAVNAEFQYGYEYLGNSGRLVITPLTDRCYLTLTGALHLKFGGAPAGPAGTGKTETTKDLAKAFAIQCVVFNCSDQLDFMAMGKFFKGLAASGAWACFDEFNRIDIEVLSVVAQQIMTIQKAQIARMDRFIFEGCEIDLKEACAVFITMNPGYAGRTELPDNLKALFRPVAMMVPDYALIAEISLFSFGFGGARQLANKIVTTFKLSSEQLSSQDHYDFGMRAVKTVIAVAGNLKRDRPNMEEQQIVLRAIRDVNVPKFLKDDLKLFNGIVSDLFPRLVEEVIDYGILETAIRNECLKTGLEDVTDFVKKVIQLYETTIVRHGLMLVGPTGSGKTQCYKMLQGAMTSIKGKLQPSGQPFQPAHTYVLNPKSITMGQLYGEFDLQTHEWTDGILPCLVRVGVSAPDKDKRWYVFDGPVDAVWIENMNTVLDDNKKLCLSSGEIIKLRDTMTMMFEVADLAVASPATVSRCGMVYLEPEVLGLQPFLNCWFKRLPNLAKEHQDAFQELFEIYLFPALELLRSEMKEILVSVDSALVQSFLRLMDFKLTPLSGKDNKPPPAPQYLALIPGLLIPWVVFSLIWSVGATTDNNGREVFSNWLKATMKTHGHAPQFPKDELVYDFKMHDGGFTDVVDDGEPRPAVWRNWMADTEKFIINIDMKYSDMEIPTIDNVRSAILLGDLLMNEDNVLCVGPTGTGKTLTIIGKLSKNMHKKFICDYINFSARTMANQTQDLIDSKLDRRRKGIFGPPLLKRQVFFIDDFNMPALEVYGAQPPIELIRQWMDFGGWYDRKNIGDFKTIIDCNFVAAMGPPGGGRNPVTARLLRHFHYIAFTEIPDQSKMQIFGCILSFWIDRTPFANLYEQTLLGSIEVYNTILAELLPTPAKTHYTFNLRDLSKIFQGLLMFVPENIHQVDEIIKLWFHECCRVFQDRLVNDSDRSWFDGLLKKIIKNSFGLDPQEALGQQAILYGDFLDPSTDVKLYVQITDMNKLSMVLDHYLDDYNTQSTRPMKLVLFLDAIGHVCRISRVIRQPMGNALLLGMGGSGRQSLTRLAAHMAEFSSFQIELTKSYGQFEWKDDMKHLMMNAGLYNIETVFLFSDTQIKSESFLEDINNMLNSGDIPNIYQPDELDKIFQEMKGRVQEMGIVATKSNLFSVYQKTVRNNLHTIITMSPIGEIFRARLRQFPALVNCCTIDWYSAWPDAALQSVALQFLDDIPNLDVTPEILHGIVVVCQFMHASVVDASELFLQELSRHNYVTPTSYLQLLSSYSDLMIKKKKSLLEGVGRLKTGLDKLKNTAEEVKILKVDLEKMKPALEIAAADADKMIKLIAADTVVAEETKMVVEKEEFEAQNKKIKTETIAADAQQDLDEAMPALLAAENSLRALNKNDITEVRSMQRPPKGVKLVMESICIAKGIKPTKIAGSKPGEKINDYWEPSRGMLSDPGQFLTSLMNFDKESITEEMIQKLAKYVDDPGFQPDKIIKVSKACTSLCMWIHAMYKYYFVNQQVAPKKAALAKAKEELAETEAALAVAKKKLNDVIDGLNMLQNKLNAKIRFKEEKERNINLCQERMGRAFRLITGLSDERVRWMQTIENIESGSVNVVGDILLSAGSVAYLTPFTDKYRRGLISEWLKVIDEVLIPHTVNCTPVSTLGEPVVIRSWQLDGLPRDYLSTENAVLVSNSIRWPLFIDPQGQANKWIKNMGKDKGMTVCKMSDKDLLRTLESAIRFGKSVLIENVGIELDPALDPILQKHLFLQQGIWCLKLGDIVVPYNDEFQLYLTTNLPNPHYTPEVAIKVLLVNFTLTPSGLQDQLLALVVMQERPDLEEQRSAIVVGIAQMKQELKEMEDRILYKLSVSEGSPVDDVEFIITLESSKVKSEDIKCKVEAAEITQIDIDNTRAQYIPVANRGQLLYFCLADLANVDPMYQYSLDWYINIFIASMADTEKCDVLKERVKIINDHLTFSLYTNVCRSLFEKHKLHFAFLMSIRILMDQKLIDHHEWHHFLAGGSPTVEDPNPAPEWISARMWNEILSLHSLPHFQKFVKTFPKYITNYKYIFDNEEPHKLPLPKEFEDDMDSFQKLVVLKCLRPDKVTNAMQDFLSEKLGERFIEPQTSGFTAMFQESSPTIPLIFVLSAGTDPASNLYKFADTKKMGKRLLSISLGQGQGPRAEAMIQEASESGSWVFFQNCHLAPSWMPRLERLIEQLQPDVVHKEFRIWLTSTPSPDFPVSILQNGSKMTVEPPRGIKANMIRAYMYQIIDLNDFFHSKHEKVFTFKWLLFSLCLFHGCLLERRKFGPLGFNIPYEFTDGDLKICISQLHMFLLEYTDIPYKVLTYTAGHINYGGRVTDDWDRRCLMNILADYYNPEVLNEEYSFDKVKVYHQLPGETPLVDYLDYVKKLPINDDPELFGLHANADITCAQALTNMCLQTLLMLQPKEVGGAAASQEEVASGMANEILKELPKLFSLEQILQKYPVLYEESLNTVLSQECIRFNKLLKVIGETLRDLLKAIKGLVVMSEMLEKMSLSLFTNMVPQIWSSKAYPSLKPLAAWVLDFHARIEFLNNWIAHGIPPAFWISGFYFPQAFLTGTLQNYARKYIKAIDTINFSFKVLDKKPPKKPDDGCVIWGPFLEGARWNAVSLILDESHPKELYTEMKPIWLLPEELHKKPGGVYLCPVYKTLTRAGVLSTTGHSTNYVLAIELPSMKPEPHWIKRGVALICALDY